MPGKHIEVPSRRGRRVLAVSAFAGVVGSLMAFGLHGDAGNAGSRLSTPMAVAKEQVRPPPPIRSTTGPEAEAVAGPSPVSVMIPAIKVDADVTSLGLKSDGTVEVPNDPAEAGWYSKGPRPGEIGSAVILGHVDSTKGPAVFYRLQNLSSGDRISVELANDKVAHFEVAKVAQYANEDFPGSKVYAGSPDRPALNLVTCGGEFDRDAGGYQSNVVVYATYLWATDA